MPTEIRPYTRGDEPAVANFNRRLRQAGIPFAFSESAEPDWLPRRGDLPIYQEYFLAADSEAPAEDAVRGAYCVKTQPFQTGGETLPIPCYQLPLTEGAANASEAMLGVRLLKHALSRSPLMMALGMGGFDPPLPRLLKSMRWAMVECPFLFYVHRPVRFLRELTFLRRDPLRRGLLDAAAFTGAGWLGIRAIHAMKTRRLPPARADEVPQFDAWVDDIWAAARDAYSFIAVRDLPILRALYPAANTRFHKLRIWRGDAPAGWAVVSCSRVSNHKQFGNMNLGAVIDCLAVPGAEPVVVAEANRFLHRLGADIAVTNQLSANWVNAFLAAGFLRGPSNYVFAASPKLAAKLADDGFSRVHMTRGDGDGPIHL